MLTLICTGTLVAAILATMGFYRADLHRWLHHSIEELKTTTIVVADELTPVITRGDRTGAGQVLASLRFDVLIRDAVIYAADGSCFAAYRRTSLGGCPVESLASVRRAPEKIVVNVSRADGGALGTLVLTPSAPPRAPWFWLYALAAIVLLVLNLAIAWLSGILTHVQVSGPRDGVLTKPVSVAGVLAEIRNVIPQVASY